MQSIQQTLRNAAVNGVISVDKALQLAGAYDKEREATVDLLSECEKESGMFLGPKIKAHIAKMTGRHFNEIEYHYEKPVGEQ
jgi:hypothetical protein